jgi:hypothetical protein
MWMSCHFFVPLAVARELGQFGSDQEYELSAMLRSSKKRDRAFCDLAFEHTDQALIFGVAPISYDRCMSDNPAAFALQELLYRSPVASHRPIHRQT